MNTYRVKKRYLKWLSLGFAAALGLMACNDSSSPGIVIPPDTQPPTVSSTTPAANATGVATNSAVTTTFSEAMQAASLTPATFYIEGVSGTVTVSADKRSATFTPSSPLATNTTYTATITTGAKDSAGNGLASNVTWSFTTAAPPVVLSTAPAANETGVATNSSVTATFSEAMQAASLTPATFYINGVSGTVAVSADARSATFTPSSPLAGNTTLTATITTGAKDATGNGLASNVTWSFTTAAAPDITPPQVSSVTPLSGSYNEASATTISITFNEAIDCTSVTTSNVRLQENVSPTPIAVPVQLLCSGSSITLQATNGTPTNANLTATVDSTVTDLAGNPMGSTYGWSFTMTPWTRQFGTASEDRANAITSDGAGNVYVAGYTAGDLDGQTNAGGTDLFVTKYDKNGVKLWTRELGTAVNDVAAAITADGAGNVYVAGYTYGDLDGQSNAGGGYTDLFVTKYDANGAKQWTRELGTTAADAATAITADGAGNIYVAGYTGGSLDGQSNAGGNDLFVTKYDANGTKQWTRELGTTTVDGATAITADGASNIYVAGYTLGALDGQSNAGGADLFVTKYDTNGTKQWTRELGTTINDEVNAITADGAGNIYVAGYTWGALDGQSNAGGTDLFVTKYDTNGTKQWTRELGTILSDFATAITADGTGNIYVAGYTNGSLDGQTFAGGVGSDLFVTEFYPDGTKQWTRELGTASDDRANAITVDAGYLYVAGFTNGGLDGQTTLGASDAFIVKYQTDGLKR